MLREKFPEFCSSPSPPVEGTGPSHSAGFARGWRPSGLSRLCAALRLSDTVHLVLLPQCAFSCHLPRFSLSI